MSDVRGVFGEDDVARELSRREPEGKVGNVIELELCMNPEGAKGGGGNGGRRSRRTEMIHCNSSY